MDSKTLHVIILAAGKGTRMKSEQAKVLHEVFFSPMLHHVIRATKPLAPQKTIIIVGHQREKVMTSIVGFSVQTAIQKEQLGTGHAVMITENLIEESTGSVMILCGDTPLIRAATLEQMWRNHLQSGSQLTLMTTVLNDPANYGRIISGTDNQIQAIVEEKDCSAAERQIKEINAGIYCVDRNLLYSFLQQVDTDNSQGEFYLTDIIRLAVKAGIRVEKFITDRPREVLGVNSRIELAEAQVELQMRRNNELMLQGITMLDPRSTVVSPDTVVGGDSEIGMAAWISDGSRLGHRCTIGQGCVLRNVALGNNVTLGPYCVLEDCSIPEGVTVPPLSTRYKTIER